MSQIRLTYKQYWKRTNNEKKNQNKYKKKSERSTTLSFNKINELIDRIMKNSTFSKIFCFAAFLMCIRHQIYAYRFTREQVLKPFIDGRAFKVIAGLNNFDADNVKKVATSAEYGGATHLDIACDPKLVKLAKSLCRNTAVCVSSIRPNDFLKAVEEGADMVEIGNFDGFYESGLRFSSKDILDLTKETRDLLGPLIPLSVTVPHTLSLPDQISLAKQLELLSVDIIQTEGKMRVDPSSMGVEQLIEKAAPSLASAYALSRAVKIPVMCSSGLSDVTVAMAFAAGARGVGVGSVINRLKDEQQMLFAVSAISDAIGLSRKDDESEHVNLSLSSSFSSSSSSSFSPEQQNEKSSDISDSVYN